LPIRLGGSGASSTADRIADAEDSTLGVTGAFDDLVDGAARAYDSELECATDGLIGRYNDMRDLRWALSSAGTRADHVDGAVFRHLGGMFRTGEMSRRASDSPGAALGWVHRLPIAP